MAWFKDESNAFAKTATNLKEALTHLSAKDTSSVIHAKDELKKCRLQYKRIAFFLEYYFPDQAIICNGPPVQEAENTQIEFKEPLGLQVIESLL